MATLPSRKTWMGPAPPSHGWRGVQEDTGRPGGEGSLAAGHRLQVISEIIGVYDPSITPDRADLDDLSDETWTTEEAWSGDQQLGRRSRGRPVFSESGAETESGTAPRLAPGLINDGKYL